MKVALEVALEKINQTIAAKNKDVAKIVAIHDQNSVFFHYIWTM